MTKDEQPTEPEDAARMAVCNDAEHLKEDAPLPVAFDVMFAATFGNED